MPKRYSSAPLLNVALEHASPVPLQRQLYDQLREAILSERLQRGTRLPSKRGLAASLGVSRNTVTYAFDQLRAEGYVEGKVGSGTYVRSDLPEDLLRARRKSRHPSLLSMGRKVSSKRAAIFAAMRPTAMSDQGKPRAFRPGLPALDKFPVDVWARIAERRWRWPSSKLLAYGEASGYWPLRAEIASYLGAMRSVRCEADQVIIVSGAQQGLDLCARVLLDSGDEVWMEDPGYLGARGALRGAEAKLVPVPVDQEGLHVETGLRRAPNARLAYVTPSHQQPLGATMSLARRLSLLDWAAKANAWVIEDDYDAEYRYAGRPLSSLQGLDQEGQVIYLGTFSKVLFPSLRLGYMVVPPNLVDIFVRARELFDRHASTLDQAVVADFIANGYFSRHLRRMRAIYDERRKALLAAASHHLEGLLEISPDEAGMDSVGWLPEGINDREASRRAEAYGVEAPPLSSYFIESSQRGGLLLGYAAVSPEQIREGVLRLAAALRSLG